MCCLFDHLSHLNPFVASNTPACFRPAKIVVLVPKKLLYRILVNLKIRALNLQKLVNVRNLSYVIYSGYIETLFYFLMFLMLIKEAVVHINVRHMYVEHQNWWRYVAKLQHNVNTRNSPTNTSELST